MKIKIQALLVMGSIIFANDLDKLSKYFKSISANVTHVKLDIGLSYNAPQSQVWLEKEDNVLVFGFEPNPESVDTISAGNIQKRDEYHGKPLDKQFIDEARFVLLPIALSDVESEEFLDFFINKDDCGTSSLYQPRTPALGEIKKVVKVPVFSLKHFFDAFPWDKFAYIDYIKIDAQGSDLKILKSAGQYLAEKVVYVTAEADGYQYQNASDCSLKNIKEYMFNQGFDLVDHPNTSDPTFLNRRYSHLKDAIFIWQS